MRKFNQFKPLVKEEVIHEIHLWEQLPGRRRFGVTVKEFEDLSTLAADEWNEDVFCRCVIPIRISNLENSKHLGIQ